MKRSEVSFLVVLVLLMGAVPFGSDRLPRKGDGVGDTAGGPFVSTGWYCLTGPVEPSSAVASIANVGDDPVRIRSSVVGDGKRSDAAESELPSRRSVSVPLGGAGVASPTGLIEAFGAATVADVIMPVAGSGLASSRCTVQPADRWLLPIVSTGRGQDHYLVVANTFDEEAVVRVRMIAPDRDLVPARLKDLLVPAQTQLAVALVDYIPETPSFGLEVVATVGRVVASSFSRYATRDGQKGTASQLGARDPATVWYLASGSVPPAGEEYIVVMNPSEKEALTQFVFHEPTQQVAPPSLNEVPVPAGRQVLVRVAEHLARGVEHGATITSTNGVPVVVARQWFGSGAFEAAIGSPVHARRWTVALGAPIGGTELLVIVNPSRSRATVDVSIVGPNGMVKPAEVAGIVVEAGRRVTIDVTALIGGGMATALVEALSGSIVVERRFSAGAPYSDFTETMGHPLG